MGVPENENKPDFDFIRFVHEHSAEIERHQKEAMPRDQYGCVVISRSDEWAKEHFWKEVLLDDIDALVDRIARWQAKQAASGSCLTK